MNERMDNKNKFYGKPVCLGSIEYIVRIHFIPSTRQAHDLYFQKITAHHALKEAQGFLILGK